LDPELVNVRFVVDRVAKRGVLLRALSSSPDSIVPSLLHTKLLYVFLVPEGRKGEKSEP